MYCPMNLYILGLSLCDSMPSLDFWVPKESLGVMVVQKKIFISKVGVKFQILVLRCTTNLCVWMSTSMRLRWILVAVVHISWWRMWLLTSFAPPLYTIFVRMTLVTDKSHMYVYDSHATQWCLHLCDWDDLCATEMLFYLSLATIIHSFLVSTKANLMR